MKNILFFISIVSTVFFCIGIADPAFALDNPFSVQASLASSDQKDAILSVSYTIPPGHHLYKDMMSISVPENIILEDISVPPPEKKYDDLSEEEREMYEHDFSAVYRIANLDVDPLQITVNYQGCDATMCFMPTEDEFSLSLKTLPTDTSATKSEAGDFASDIGANWQSLITNFTIEGSAAGYLKSADFISFLDKVEAGEAETNQSIIDKFKNRGTLLSVILIIIGGFLLNLTPCVLPMIPVNLGIIGAGVQAGTRKRGFVLGSMFGLGMALVYGLLGLVVMFSGSQFGTINSTWWFNLGIAGVFIVLSLAMFDVITIDFTKYQHSAASGWTNKGTTLAAFMLGGITALLAGACVAPVIIQVLIISADFYSRGIALGLFLPFLLGIGMALPWPFAGAGLSFLPKPGVWMTRVKYGFGILILLFAGYYGWVGFTAIDIFDSSTPAIVKSSADDTILPHLSSLPEALRAAQADGKPVFIDFWATWCKNCIAMDKSTFKNPAVRQKLESYIVLKYQAEKPNKQPAKAVLDHFDVKGLPTYVILHPITAHSQ